MRIKLDHINVIKGNSQILKEVSLDSPSGLILGILGPNGSGKTTLLNTFFEERAGGNISLGDKDLVNIELSEKPYILAGAFKSENIASELTVIDILKYARHFKDQDEDFLSRVVDDFELGSLLEHKTNSLSGGELQRVNLASVIYQDARILIFDEPTNYLDPKHVKFFAGYLQKLSKRKKVIVSSHDINFLLSFCDQLIGLKNGNLIFDQTAPFVKLQDSLNDLFDVEFQFLEKEHGVIIL